jgi:hypothetical protein
MESDWRKFRDMVPMLRERYLAEHNARIAAMLADPQKNGTDRFWEAMEEMERQAKVLRQCLDGHSRSKMWLYVMLMVRHRMLRKEDLEGFSDELRSKAESVLNEMEG